MPRKSDALIAVAGLGLVAWALSRQTSREEDDSSMYELEVAPVTPDSGVYVDNSSSSDDLSNSEVIDMDSSAEAKTFAILYMIRMCEHSRSDVLSGVDYQTFYGGDRFSNMSDHPVVTGEKKGVRLSDEVCRAAGYGPGCVTTAAGAYQLTRPTWQEFRVGGSWGPFLPDFSNASQDEAARRILVKNGALALLLNGDVTGAIRKASARWASLPGSKAGQKTRALDFAIAAYEEGLAEYAGL